MTAWNKIIHETFIVAQLFQKLITMFEVYSSSRCSPESATGPFVENVILRKEYETGQILLDICNIG